MERFELNNHEVIRKSWMSDDSWEREKNRCGKWYGYIYGTRVATKDLSKYFIEGDT